MNEYVSKQAITFFPLSLFCCCFLLFVFLFCFFFFFFFFFFFLFFFFFFLLFFFSSLSFFILSHHYPPKYEAKYLCIPAPCHFPTKVRALVTLMSWARFQLTLPAQYVVWIINYHSKFIDNESKNERISNAKRETQTFHSPHEQGAQSLWPGGLDDDAAQPRQGSSQRSFRPRRRWREAWIPFNAK